MKLANLVEELKQLTKPSELISWITAFTMESGVREVLDSLKDAQANGAIIQILTGDYLYITQPKALRLLLAELLNAEVRLYHARGKSFHPKVYLFRHPTTQHLIVGSSNLSKSALTSGVEWSLQTVDEPTFEHAMDEFTKLFYAEQTIPLNEFTLQTYESNYRKANEVMKLSNQWDKSEETQMMNAAIFYS